MKKLYRPVTRVCQRAPSTDNPELTHSDSGSFSSDLWIPEPPSSVSAQSSVHLFLFSQTHSLLLLIFFNLVFIFYLSKSSCPNVLSQYECRQLSLMSSVKVRLQHSVESVTQTPPIQRLIPVKVKTRQQRSIDLLLGRYLRNALRILSRMTPTPASARCLLLKNSHNKQ